MKPHLTLCASALALVMTTPATADVDSIREIDVTADLSAIEGETAAAYWRDIETDLEAAIALRVDALIAEDPAPGASAAGPGNETAPPEGTSILVDIRDVELANAFQRTLELGDAVLVGQVTVVDLEDNSNADGYELSVSLEAARVVLPEGVKTVTLMPDDTETYALLVDTFAQGVVDRLN